MKWRAIQEFFKRVQQAQLAQIEAQCYASKLAAATNSRTAENEHRLQCVLATEAEIARMDAAWEQHLKEGGK